jgi:glycosyltransferase involved in cell wall biosynthesis
MNRRDKISIIIPTLNEEKNLPIVLEDVKSEMKKRKHRYEIIVVDGYSKDATVKIAKKHGCKIIYENIGKGHALRLGLAEAKGDVIVMMDADCSHRGLELGLLIEAINSGYDICMGSRFIQGGGSDDITLFRRIGNKFFVFLVNRLWKTNYSDLCYGYRSFSRKAVNMMNLTQNGFGIETEISIQAAKNKLNILEIPSYEKSREFGKGNLRTFNDGWKILKTIAKEMRG